MEWINENRELVVYISIPLVSGFIGWFTNKVAIEMTFYPLKFWGIPPYLGWQGIIPRKAYKMSSKAVDMITKKLIRVEELFDRVEPSRVAKEMSPTLLLTIAQIVDEIGMSSNAQLWSMVPVPVREGIYQRVAEEVSPVVEKVVLDTKSNIIELLDLKNLVIKNLTGPNVQNLVEIFQKVGKKEFQFIELSGLYIGFLMGCLQAGVWYFYQAAWMLPVIGVIVGYLTNWIAIQMIFRPLREKTYLGFFRYQGLFLRRQKEVSVEYSRLVAGKILTARNILGALIYGRAADQMFGMIQRHIINGLARIEGFAKPVLSIIVGSAEYENARQYIIEKLSSSVPKSLEKVEDYMENAMDLENTMSSRMSQLEPEEFEELLRTAFQEDEIILILVGAVLGFLVGLGQAFVV